MAFCWCKHSVVLTQIGWSFLSTGFWADPGLDDTHQKHPLSDTRLSRQGHVSHESEVVLSSNSRKSETQRVQDQLITLLHCCIVFLRIYCPSSRNPQSLAPLVFPRQFRSWYVFYVSTLGRYSFHAIFCSHMSFMQDCAQWQAVVAPKCNCWMWIWIEMWPRHIVPWVKPQVLCASCSRLEMLEAYPSFCPKVSYILGPILGVPKW